MGSLEDVHRNWEIYAGSDPMWAALMDPEKQGGRWDPKAFFATGEQEIETVLGHVAGLGLAHDTAGEALDFGCGIGRLTQALARRFDSACGVDISATMVERARAANELPGCRFVVNESDDLAQFEDGRFSFIYSSVVLQHMEPRYSTAYMREFARVLAPGGVVTFQVPDRVERGTTARQRARLAGHRLRRALGLRTRGRRALRRLGLLRSPPDAGEAAAEMHCVPEDEVRALLEHAGLVVADVQLTNSTDLEFVGGLRYLSSPPPVGFVSKQYCARKEAPR